MRTKTQNIKLPQKLLEELGIAGEYIRGPKTQFKPIRKEGRKAERVHRKGCDVIVKSRANISSQWLDQQRPKRQEISRDVSKKLECLHSDDESDTNKIQSMRLAANNSEAATLTQSAAPKIEPALHLSSKRTAFPQKSRDWLDADDAEIAALEKALGLKEDGKLSKAFIDDGLDMLIGDLAFQNADQTRAGGKRKRTEEQQWLDIKRRKVNAVDEKVRAEDDEALSDVNSLERMPASGDDVGTDPSDTDQRISSARNSQARRSRENPYIAPILPSENDRPQKYCPPSLRSQDASAMEDLSRLRRQLQGLLNRLSEANLTSILEEIEKLYRNSPRQTVTTLLLDLLMSLLCDPAALQDTFIILHAGFLAAAHKVIGMDFGAQAIQRIFGEFFRCYEASASRESAGKKLTNLISLLANLYNFQVLSNHLIYDFIRLFLENLSELTTELILKVLRNSGSQLRQDNASSLKDIVLLLQSAVAKKEDQNLSIRTKFMIETITNLKNNRIKSGIISSTVAVEHINRMKKTLSSLNTKASKASEPLGVGLEDLRNSKERGKWWLIGASYNSNVQQRGTQREDEQIIQELNQTKDPGVLESSITDFAQLARNHRMNSDVRRSVFIAIMSASDYKDAHIRLQKLHLKKSQELEIPQILIHCAGAEQHYNPFYALVARRICSSRKLSIAFQFCLWNFFKRMGEEGDNSENEDDEAGEDTLGLREIVNLAKLFGVLIAEGGLRITALKTLNFASLRPQTRTFTEILLITTVLHSQSQHANSQPPSRRDEKPLLDIFLGARAIPTLVHGLQYFLAHVVSNTDMAGSKGDYETVKWGCDVVVEALGEVMADVVVAKG